MYLCSLPLRLACAAALIGALPGAFANDRVTQLPSPSGQVAPEWLTKAEKTDFAETARYEETLAFCTRLAQASPLVDYQVRGTSPEKRDIPILILADDQAFTPDKAAAAGKTVVFLNNCIHAGEVAGKDASLMLLRDIAIGGRHRQLLNNLVLVVMPIFNVDGHERFSPFSRINQNGPSEMGWRVTAQNLDLNRDFVKADAPEMRIWLRTFNEWKPHLLIDNHTTNGGDWQFDLALVFTSGPWVHPLVDQWVTTQLQPHLLQSLEAAGHLPCPYFSFLDRYDVAKGIRSGGGFSPRYSTGYCALRNRISILVEAHAYKPYRTRVIATYRTMLGTMTYLNEHPAQLRGLLRQADQDTIAGFANFDPAKTFPLRFRHTQTSEPFVFKGYAQQHVPSQISGRLAIHYDRSRPFELTVPHFHKLESAVAVTPPLGYLIPPQFTEVINLLALHDLQAYRLDAPVTDTFEVYHLAGVSYPARSFQGRHQPNFAVDLSAKPLTFPSQSVYVPVSQPAGPLVLHP